MSVCLYVSCMYVCMCAGQCGQTAGPIRKVLISGDSRIESEKFEIISKSIQLAVIGQLLSNLSISRKVKGLERWDKRDIAAIEIMINFCGGQNIYKCTDSSQYQYASICQYA